MLSMTLDWLTGWVKLETHFISLSHKEIEESLYDCLFFPCLGSVCYFAAVLGTKWQPVNAVPGLAT